MRGNENYKEAGQSTRGKKARERLQIDPEKSLLAEEEWEAQGPSAMDGLLVTQLGRVGRCE